ncbi:MAG: hypothetical protein HY718_07300 [Planctomycetes bacterium]|nr:hypothetical protein [Planctomycetota bacterium]
MDHIEHRAHVEVGAVNIDVTIELRFNEFQSLAERRRMDADRDGRLSPAERSGYLKRVGRQVADAFRLACRGRPLDLIELYDPEIDFLGVEGISPSHHVLKLSYFARTPADLAARDDLSFEDRSWPTAPALWFFTAGGKDGIVLKVEADAATTQPATANPPSATSRPAPAATQPVGAQTVLAGRCVILGRLAQAGAATRPANPSIREEPRHVPTHGTADTRDKSVDARTGRSSGRRPGGGGTR